MDPSIDALKASDGTGNASVATVTNVRSAGATTIQVDTVDNINTNFYGTMGTPHTFTDPVTSEEITIISEATAVDFRGHVDGSNLEIDEIADGYTDGGSEVGDIVVIKPTTQWADAVAEVLEVSLNDDGSLKAVTANPGWTEMTGTTLSVASGHNSGNRSFTLDSDTDLTGIISNGMRFKIDRDTTPPDQCADLEASSSQYASKSSPAGITFTDDFTCEAWIKLESYTGAIQTIINKRTSTNGFSFRINVDGSLNLIGFSSGTNEAVSSYQSIPLGKWVHVAATYDASGATSVMYMDGVAVPSYQSTGLSAITQGGDLYIGRRSDSAADYFDGELADVRVWSDIRTATEIRDNMYNYPSDTTGLVAHFKLDGDWTDSSANGNDLTASGSPTFVSDNPWNATEYGVITAVTSSTIQVFCPEGYGIPLETLTSPYYSTQDTPYGFPRDEGKWAIENFYNTEVSQATTLNTLAALTGVQLTVPIGAWDIGYQGYIVQTNSSAGAFAPYFGISTSQTTTSIKALLTSDVSRTSIANAERYGANQRANVSHDSQALYYGIVTHGTGAGTITVGIFSSSAPYSPSFVISAKCAYI